MKKIVAFTLLISLILIAAPVNVAYTLASAAEIDPSALEWRMVGVGGANHSIEDGVFKIENIEHTGASFQTTVPVKANTVYRASVMIRLGDDFERLPENVNAGAYLHIMRASANNSNVITIGTTKRVRESTGEDWVKYTMEFNSADNTTVILSLRNGVIDNTAFTMSKGTAWFRDIKLERGIPTNHWNILHLSFTDIDAEAGEFRGNPGHRFKSAVTEAQLSFTREVVTGLPERLYDMSGGLMTAEVDMFTITEPITSLTRSAADDYRIYPENISDVLNAYLPTKEYHQIIITAPLSEMGEAYGGGWGDRRAVLGYGVKHWSVCTNDVTYFYYYLLHVHEVIHGLESKAGFWGTGHFHRYNDRLQEAGISRHDSYAGYLRNSLGEGLPPEVFTVYNYVEVCMITGEIIPCGHINRTTADCTVCADTNCDQTGLNKTCIPQAPCTAHNSNIPTGLGSMTGYTIAMSAFLILSAGLWGYIFLGRRRRGNV